MADRSSISSLVSGFPLGWYIRRSLPGYCHDHWNGFISPWVSIFFLTIGTERVDGERERRDCWAAGFASRIDPLFLIFSNKLGASVSGMGCFFVDESFSILLSNSWLRFLRRFSSDGESCFFSWDSRTESQKVFKNSICFLYAYPPASQNWESIFLYDTWNKR